MESGYFHFLAWCMAICSGLMSGIYLVFSVVIMKSFATLHPSNGIDAMNAINRIILRTAFMPLFFGSTVLALLMLLASTWFWGQPGSVATFAAGLIYVFGMFVVTLTGNVPLNNALARVGGDGENALHIWNAYLKLWTRWNSLRTAGSVVTLVICLDLLSRYNN